MIRNLLAAALVGTTLVAPASAADRRSTVQAGAGGRFETHLDPKTRAHGFSAAQVAAFRPRVQNVIDLFAAMPAVNSPPAPLCNRLGSWIEDGSPHGLLAAEVGVMAPISFENGRCHRMTGTGVVIRLNALSLLLDPQQAIVRRDEGPSDWFLMPQAIAGERVIRMGKTVAFTHGRAPLLTPVSAERYLTEMLKRAPADPEGGDAGELARWLAEGKPKMLADNAQMLRELEPTMKPTDLAKMKEAVQVVVDSTEKDLRRMASTSRGPTERQRLEAELSALGTAAGAAPACIAPGKTGLDPAPGCPEGLIVTELNPAYFDKSRPDAIQLLVVETPEGRTHGENDAKLAARMAIWESLDHNALAALVR